METQRLEDLLSVGYWSYLTDRQKEFRRSFYKDLGVSCDPFSYPLPQLDGRWSEAIFIDTFDKGKLLRRFNRNCQANFQWPEQFKKLLVPRFDKLSPRFNQPYWLLISESLRFSTFHKGSFATMNCWEYLIYAICKAVASGPEAGNDRYLDLLSMTVFPDAVEEGFLYEPKPLHVNHANPEQGYCFEMSTISDNSLIRPVAF
jgi:hypothetical protein